MLNEAEFLRLEDIAPRRGRKNGGVGFLPLSRSTFLTRVRDGELPAPIYLSPGCPMWKRSELLEAIEKIARQRARNEVGA